MKTLYIECSMGVAGDMLMGALLELVPDQAAALARLNAVGIPGVEYRAVKTEKCGIVGTKMQVLIHGEEEGACQCGCDCGHDHHHHDHHGDHDHHHEHDHHHHEHEHSHDHHHGQDHCHEHEGHGHCHGEHRHVPSHEQDCGHHHDHHGDHDHHHGHEHHHDHHGLKDIECLIETLHLSEPVKEKAL